MLLTLFVRFFYLKQSFHLCAEFCAKLFEHKTKSIFEICDNLVFEIFDTFFKDFVQLNKRLRLYVQNKRGEDGKKIYLALDVGRMSWWVVALLFLVTVSLWLAMALIFKLNQPPFADSKCFNNKPC